MSNWLRDYYDELDSGRLDSWTERNAEDIVLQMGNLPPIEGREQVLEAERGFLTTISSHRHRFVNVFVDGDTSVLEAVVTYHRLDGNQVDVPVTTILHRRDELVDSARVYLDIAPVYAEIPAPEASA